MMKYLRNIFAAVILSVIGYVAVYAENNNADPQSIAAEAPACVIRPGSHCVEISVTDDDTHQVTIYALTGQVVKQISVSDTHNVVELNPGYYIVRVDGLSKRVVVK